jgi:hypothetical protein
MHYVRELLRELVLHELGPEEPGSGLHSHHVARHEVGQDSEDEAAINVAFDGWCDLEATECWGVPESGAWARVSVRVKVK